MTHLITCIVFAIGGALASGILVDLKWKEAAKKLIEKISSLESGLGIKQSEINNLNTKLISMNSRINMLDATLCQKDQELNQLVKKVNVVPAVDAFKVAPVKKRGPYKKKKYGRPASNNNSGKKAE